MVLIKVNKHNIAYWKIFKTMKGLETKPKRIHLRTGHLLPPLGTMWAEGFSVCKIKMKKKKKATDITCTSKVERPYKTSMSIVHVNSQNLEKQERCIHLCKTEKSLLSIHTWK